MILFGACSPADQSAITLDRRTGMPALVLVLCPGEAVRAVELSVAAVDADGYAVEGEVLWRAEAEQPRRATRIIAGVAPTGFVETVPARDISPHDRLVMTAEVGGGVAGHHGVGFDPRSLSSEELQKYGNKTSRADLLRAAKANCSGNPLDAIGLSTSAMVVIGFVFAGACLLGALVPWAVIRRSERR